MGLILGGILLCFSTLIGYILSGKFTDKQSFYYNFITFNSKLKNELHFGQSTLISIIKDIDKDSDFYKLFYRCVIENKDYYNINYLSKKENDYFKMYLQDVGKGDVKSQIEYLENINKTITLEYDKILEQNKKYKTLYIKMGFLIGLILLILVL